MYFSSCKETETRDCSESVTKHGMEAYNTVIYFLKEKKAYSLLN